MPSHPQKEPKPPVLKRRGPMLRFLMILIGLFVLTYVAIAATGFLRNQSDEVESVPAATGQIERDRP